MDFGLFDFSLQHLMSVVFVTIGAMLLVRIARVLATWKCVRAEVIGIERKWSAGGGESGPTLLSYHSYRINSGPHTGAEFSSNEGYSPGFLRRGRTAVVYFNKRTGEMLARAHVFTIAIVGVGLIAIAYDEAWHFVANILGVLF